MLSAFLVPVLCNLVDEYYIYFDMEFMNFMLVHTYITSADDILFYGLTSDDYSQTYPSDMINDLSEECSSEECIPYYDVKLFNDFKNQPLLHEATPLETVKNLTK